MKDDVHTLFIWVPRQMTVPQRRRDRKRDHKYFQKLSSKYLNTSFEGHVANIFSEVPTLSSILH